ncbi:MAG: peptidylprolyl isomerase, partial [Bacteroidota bacterium]
MKKLTGIIVLLCLIAGNLSAQTKVLDKLVGVVGDEIILYSELQENLQYIKSQQGGIMPEGVDCYVMDQLLTQRLLLNIAKLDSVEVSDDEVAQNVEARI